MNYSDNFSTRYLGIVIGLVAGIAVLRRLTNTPEAKARRAGAKLPPGPKRDLLLGNIRNFPKARWYETFTRWKGEFGDVVYLNVLGTSMIVCNSLEAVEELTVKRAHIYSGRPYTVMSNKLMSIDWFTALLQPGHTLTEQRKFIRKAIGPQTAQEYDWMIQSESIPLIQSLSGFVGDPLPKLVRAVGAVILKSGFGEKIYREHGEEMTRLNTQRAELSTWVFTKFWLVNFFPSLQYLPTWFPGTTFHRVGQEGTRLAKRLRYIGWDLVQQDIADGIADESIISKHINDPTISKEDLRDTVAMLYAVGFDNTSASVAIFLYTLMLYPDVQRKVHAELDQQYGAGQIPSMAEIQKLKYFNAAWNESMRWNATIPLGVPHSSTQDDIWNGYYIPKGTIIHCNIGCILRDPRLWGEDAHLYNPDRFLAEHNPRAKDLPDMSTIPFGSGRRICPGRWFAERITLGFSAAVLSAYEIVPIDGHTRNQVMEFADAIVRRPTNFRCKFIPRH
ncbi:cytochrome P450 [Serendipita vermifera]|nr:cytochrome P450 [Serendipita vermifera]